MLFSLSKTVLSSLCRKPPTRLYPVEKREPFGRTRGHIEINISACTFCGLCSKKCPTGAITVTRQPDKKWEINRLQCIACDACREACPKKVLSMETSYASPALATKRDSFKIARVPDNSANS